MRNSKECIAGTDLCQPRVRWGRVGGPRERVANTNVLWGLGSFARRLTGMCPCLQKVPGSPWSRLRNLESWERAEKTAAGKD